MNYEIGSYYKRCYDEYLYAVFQVIHINGSALTVKLITDYGEQFKKEGDEAGLTLNGVAWELSAITTMTTGTSNCSCGICNPPAPRQKLYYTELDKRDILMSQEEYAYELL